MCACKKDKGLRDQATDTKKKETFFSLYRKFNKRFLVGRVAKKVQ